MKRDANRPELLAAGEATLALGTWAAGLRYADLPPEVAAKVQECVLDALALGEWRGGGVEPVSGRDFITAVAAGYEVALRAGAGPAMSPERP